MTVCDQFIDKIAKTLPEACSVMDLVKVGIFKSAQAEAHYRKSGDAPPYFKFKRRIMYPRDGVIEWLRDKLIRPNG